MTIASPNSKTTPVLRAWPTGGPVRHLGRLSMMGRIYPCALGRSGVSTFKREGDGASPLGIHVIRGFHVRADKWPAPPGRARPIRPDDGWCDDAASPDYNRLVRLPRSDSHEEMWRADHLYDVVIELGWNDDPPRPGRGSAIFMHLARPGFKPTEGCIAVAPAVMRRVLSVVRAGDTVSIQRTASG